MGYRSAERPTASVSSTFIGLCDKGGIQRVWLGQQSSRTVVLRDRALLEDQDLVGMSDRAQPVGDGKRRDAVKRLASEDLLDRLVRLEVDARGRLWHSPDDG